MPYRKLPFVSGEIYHVFNRSIAKQPIFLKSSDYQRAIEVINYYRYSKLPLRLSHFKRLSTEEREKFFDSYMKEVKPMLQILAYCIMPNHVHFLLQPKLKNSTSDFMRNFQNSYSKYFNTKHKRTGSLFQFMFKAVRIESDEQLLHISRYIHLNPVSSYMIKEELLETYPWSSLKDYISTGEKGSFVNPELIMSQFKSGEEYKKFVRDQLGYQRELEHIKHLVLE